MIRCYHCGTDNLDGSEYCDECGTKLSVAAAPARPAFVPPPPPSQMTAQTVPAPTPVVPPPPAFTRESVTPKPATPYTPPPPPIPPPPAVQAATQIPPPPPVITSVVPQHNSTMTYNGPADGLSASGFSAHNAQAPAMNNQVTANSAPSVRAKLIIQRGGQVGKEFPIANAESMIGRWDADGGIFPDIDLDQDDPEAKVSRRHARIQFANNQYLIEDLGSTNGTFINRGPRLLPGNKQPLNHGDEIIVGKTFLKFVLS
ncbi:MAG: FHA domain-containing protein [Acidobacteriota bacterium]